MDGKGTGDVGRERDRRLTEQQERITGEIKDDMVGSRQTVMIDDVDEAKDELTERLERDAPEIDGHVVIETEPEEGLLQIGSVGEMGAGMAQPAGLVGRFAQVVITGAYPYELPARLAGKVW